jgi:hypothetical protein
MDSPTLRSSRDSASVLPCSSPLRIATSRPALVRIPSTRARLSSRLVRVVARAPSRAAPPKNVPSRRDREVDWVISEISDATGRGSSVAPEAGWISGSFSAIIVH